MLESNVVKTVTRKTADLKIGGPRHLAYGVDHDEYDLFLGYINYAPNYNTCQ